MVLNVMNNIALIENSSCCGCTTCMAVCPVNAIQMSADEQGFLYPQIDASLCVDCGLCLKTCKKEYRNEQIDSHAYAAQNSNQFVLQKSSSGGIGLALCMYAVEHGGVVYGVAYDRDFHVVTQRAQTLEACIAFCGSKYVQSDLQLTMCEVEKDLQDGRFVLYFGTSCHVNGLLAALDAKKIDRSQLITVDLICHGVPSPRLFEDYIKYISKNDGLKSYAFRTKALAWGGGSMCFGTRIEYHSGKVELDSLKARAFLNLFFSNNCLRPSCYQCKYCGINKPSDITIADFWGVENEHPDFYSKDGVSAVIVHTEKGRRVFELLRDVVFIDSTIAKISNKQGNFKNPSPKGQHYDAFWKLYEEKGFLAIAKKYAGMSLVGKLKHSELYKLYKRIKYGR